MVDDTEDGSSVQEASKADIAADMRYHRGTYRRFLRIVAFAILPIAVILLILLFVYS